MNIAVVTPYNLFTARHGNAVRVNAMIRALQTYDHRISLIMYDLPNQKEIGSINGLKAYFKTVKKEILLASILSRLFIKASTFDLLCAKYSPVRGFSSVIRKILKKDEIDLIQCENIWTVPPLSKIAEEEDIPIVATAHDVWTDRFIQLYEYQRTFKFVSKALIQRIKETEISGIESCDFCVCVSSDDRERFIEMGISPEKLVVIPNGVDTNQIYPMEKTEDLKEKLGLGDDFVLFFSGSEMFQNKKAVDDICKIILPNILKIYPRVKMIFAGTICGYVHKVGYQTIFPNNIITVGYVENLNPYYSLADIVLIPITMGSGTKLKTIEAMAAGKALISTTEGITGLNVDRRGDLIVEDCLERFHEQVQSLMEDESLRRRMGENARRKSMVYDWEKLMKEYDALYKKFYS